MPSKLIDSHAHLTGEAYTDSDIAHMLKRAHEASLAAIINICTDQISLERALKLSEPSVFHAAAIPPHDVHQKGLDSYFEAIVKALQENRLVAIGETGLDLVNAEGALSEQIIWLKRHIDLAKEFQKPLIFHCREAFDPLFRILDEEGYKGPALIHCFTGTREEAQEVVRRGFYLSLSGILTFKKSEELRRTAQEMPLHQLMIETDCPWLSPESKRGQVNEPAYLGEIADKLADVRGEEVRNQLFTNTTHFFSLCL